MPDNHDHDASPIFDWHDHHDTGHHYAVTHDHDVHPRHHHDGNGSVIYLRTDVHDRDVLDIGPYIDDGHRRQLDAYYRWLIAELHSRTTPPAGTDAP